jgi:hypothetical protein
VRAQVGQGLLLLLGFRSARLALLLKVDVDMGPVS